MDKADIVIPGLLVAMLFGWFAATRDVVLNDNENCGGSAGRLVTVGPWYSENGEPSEGDRMAAAENDAECETKAWLMILGGGLFGFTVGAGGAAVVVRRGQRRSAGNESDD